MTERLRLERVYCIVESIATKHNIMIITAINITMGMVNKQ